MASSSTPSPPPPDEEQDSSSSSIDKKNDNSSFMTRNNSRRATLATLLVSGGGSSIAAMLIPLAALAAPAEQGTKQESMYAPNFVQEYSDFEKTSEGWSFRDVVVKTGKQQQQQQDGGESSSSSSPTWGDRVVFDWSGYTIGYFGRPFEAKGGPQGGAFDKDLDFSRAVLGQHTIVHGLECAFTSMKVGGIRQVIIPYGGELGYPEAGDDMDHKRVGPKPSTFSGQRALNFVLENPRVDRTLLFNIKLVRIDKPNGNGGFTRGG